MEEANDDIIRKQLPLYPNNGFSPPVICEKEGLSKTHISSL